MPLNYAKTALLLALLTAIFVAMGAVVGGRTGMVIAFVAALVMNVLSLWNSDKIVLRMFKARQVDASSAPVYYGLVKDLAAHAGLPLPKVFIIPSPQPNAFATGRSPEHSAVAASTGLLETLSREELAGVIAHELAHIKNRDTLTMTVAATIGGAISMLAQYMQFSMLFGGHRSDRGALGWIGAIVAMIAAPFAAMLVQMAISRSREYQADRLGAEICGNPLWLASALQRIHAVARRKVNPVAEQVPAAAHMFIVNPLTGRGVDNWFSTHPDVKNRVSELKAMAREMGVASKPLSPAPAESDMGNRSDEPDTVIGPWSSARQRRKKKGPWG